ncbi:uncharacterized protein LOC106647236 [Copidosoma floridanum]|uniref:uncharacterized protein LOC106647236 n=1 Tax=Copidosoma floridanum TaxID=29053 RepID=UPI0006C99891|nr:uncharacterized protein LOC106647236 [Copidosoma floridanum]
MFDYAKLCLNCLCPHKFRDCRSTTLCTFCQQKHHTLMHRNSSSSQSQERGVDPENTTKADKASNAKVILNTSSACCSNTVLLATARIQIVSPSDLKPQKTSAVLTGLGGLVKANAIQLVTFKIKPHFKSKFSLETSALVINRVSSYLPPAITQRVQWDYFKGLQLADPYFLNKDPVDLLLDVVTYATIIEGPIIKKGPDYPTAVKSSIGWLQSGAVSSLSTVQNQVVSLNICQEDNVSDLLQKFWQLEEPLSCGFKLQKWSSNSKEILAEISEEFYSSNPLKLQDDHEVTSVLGLNWNSDLDSFSFKVNLPSSDPIWTKCSPVDLIIEIHGFADASKRAYAAVLYLRPLTTDMVFTSLEIYKTKVAPLKTLSIPRLELCGAHLLSKLVNHHVSTTKVQALAIHLYTDPMDTLCWIKSIPSKWPTFNAIRCFEIQTLTPTAYWHHVKTKENPADLASRGVLPKQLIGQKLWFEGPDFLRSREIVFSDISPKNSSEGEDTVLKEMLSVNALEYQDKLLPDTYSAYSSWHKLFKVSLNRNSSVAKLNPVLVNGVIRVGGRLRKASIPSQTEHPLILAPKDYLTDLIINYHHNLVLHGGTLLNSPSQLDCARASSSSILECPAFTKTGVDYAGPYTIRLTKLRGKGTQKGYICIFICLVTRSVHLEVVKDFSSEACLAAFSRFTSRRGYCSHLYSDRGTNFVGASSELKETLCQFLRSCNLSNKLLKAGTNWHFNPPSAPYFGGLWEFAVKSAKRLLKQVIGGQVLTSVEFSTLLCKIEACLNSCLLVPQSDDPFDLEFYKRWANENLVSLQVRQKWIFKQRAVQVNDLVLILQENTPTSHWPLGQVTQVLAGSNESVRVVKVRTTTSTLTRPVVKLAQVLPAEEFDVHS